MKKLLIILIFLSPLLVQAQGFQVNLQGQKQQSMGGTGTGTALDEASIFFNPGAVSHLEKNGVSVGISPTIANSTFESSESQSQARTNSPVSTPFTGYAVFGQEESKFKFGLGVYTPFGSTIKWEDEWKGRFLLTKLQLFSVFIQPTVSYKISDKIGIGAGFVYGIGKIDLRRDIPASDGTSDGSAKLTGNASGIGFNAGIYLKPIEKLSIGITYRSQVNMKVNNGNAEFTVPSTLSSTFPNGAFSSSLPLPQVISIGVGVTPIEKLLITADVNFIGWSAYKELSFDYENNTSKLEDTKSARNYKNTFAFRLGGQYSIKENFRVRAGIAYQLTPVRDGYVTPEVPDANKISYTAGIGYKFADKLTVDASFTFEDFAKRTDTNKEANFSATYKTYIAIPGISLTYNF
ncbi:MAG: outer membrane protein transport protein [Cytophagaceae bacterium]|nr:outer membrane protein transport protein [Cytophagaceae bacterium]